MRRSFTSRGGRYPVVLLLVLFSVTAVGNVASLGRPTSPAMPSHLSTGAEIEIHDLYDRDSERMQRELRRTGLRYPVFDDFYLYARDDDCGHSFAVDVYEYEKDLLAEEDMRSVILNGRESGFIGGYNAAQDSGSCGSWFSEQFRRYQGFLATFRFPVALDWDESLWLQFDHFIVVIGYNGVSCGPDCPPCELLEPSEALPICVEIAEGILELNRHIPPEGEPGSVSEEIHAVAQVKWRFPTSNVGSSPAIGPDGTVYVGSVEGIVWAINPDGTEKWRFDTPTTVDSSPAIGSDGTVYVLGGDEFFYALNPDGTLKFKVEIQLGGCCQDSSPAIGLDGTVYVGAWDQNLYAIGPDGRVKWKYTTNGEISSSPAVAPEGTIYAGSGDGCLYSIRADGSLLWRLPIGPKAWNVDSSPALDPNGVVYVGSDDGAFCAVNPDGSKRWDYVSEKRCNFGIGPMPCSFSSPTIGGNGTVYVTSSDGSLYAFSPDGSLKWQYATGTECDYGRIGYVPCPIDSAPAIGRDGTIYFGSFDRNVYAINPDGTVKWRVETGYSIMGSSPVIAPDGTLYIGSYDGYLYAINTESGGLSDAPWPMFHHDAAHTGRAQIAVDTPVESSLSEQTDEELAEEYIPNILQLECDIEAGNGIEWVAYHVERQDTLARIEYSVVFADEDHPDPLLNAAYDLTRGAMDIETFYVMVDLQADEITELAFHYPYRSTCPAEILGFLDCRTGVGCGTWYGGQGYGVAVPFHYCRIFEGEEIASEFGFSHGHPDLYIATWNHLFSSEPVIDKPASCDRWRRYTHETLQLVEQTRAELEEAREAQSVQACRSWSRTFDGSSVQWGFSVQQTSDGGYILLGEIRPYGLGLDDFWLIKTDAAGRKQWDRTFGGTGIDTGYSVQQTQDGGYILLGDTYSYGHGPGHSDAWLIKTDAAGDREWDKTFGGSNYDSCGSIQETRDGGYILLGSTDSYGTGERDLWLIKTDAYGNKRWDRTFGGRDSDWASSLQQTGDGGYILLGNTKSYGAGEADFWLVKTDAYGNKQWDRTFGGRNWDVGYSVQQTRDGGYILLGRTGSCGAGQDDFWLIKTDAYGNKQWDRTFGGSKDDWGRSVQQTRDGGYILLGSTESYGAGQDDLWLIKTDAYGYIQWDKTFGGSKDDWARSVQQISDGSYILLGNTNTESYGAGETDVWLIKYCPEAEEVPAVSTPESIYPIYDYPQAILDPFGGDIPIYVGNATTSITVEEVGESFVVDAKGYIHMSYLDIFRILAQGDTTITLAQGSNESRTVQLLFSVPKGGEFDFLREAGHEWITGFLGDEGSESAWEGSVTFPTSLYESLRLSWAVEKANLDDFYQGLDEALKLLQFVYLLTDPDVKEYLVGRIQEAKRSGRRSELRAVYREIEKVLITMGPLRRSPSKSPISVLI